MNIRYERLCLWKPQHCPTIICLVQLMCNYITFFAQKYKTFNNKMAHMKFMEFIVIT